MAAVTGYSAGVESNDTQISYGMEAVWGTKPSVQFQNIRYTGESLAQTRTRQRPTEITATAEAAQGVTTQQTAAGTVNYALSADTFDDWFSIALRDDWGALQTINGIGGDITLTAGPPIILSSSLAGKFANIIQGQWIRLLGFSTAVNNGFWYVSAKSSPDTMTLTGPVVPQTETPTGTNAKIRCSSLRNGTTFKTMFVQKKLSASMFLQYPGAFVTRAVINGGLGNFGSGTFDITAQQESKVTVDGSTGAVLAAPSGRVVDPIGGFVGVYWNETAISSGIDRFSITLENTGAASEFAMGSAAAQGILGGTFTASATFRAYFKDFTLYDSFTAETAGRAAFIVKDPAGKAYAWTLLQAVLANCRILAGGAGQPVFAEFDVEGGPSGSGTFVMDRMAAT